MEVLCETARAGVRACCVAYVTEIITELVLDEIYSPV